MSAEGCGIHHTPEEKLVSSFVVMPLDCNHYGNMHGGEMMKSADNHAYAIASRYCRQNVVTACVKEVNFLNPVRIGDMVTLYGEIVRVGKSSLDVQVCITAEKLKTGEEFSVADAYFVMVAVDENGKAVDFNNKSEE